MVRGLRVSGGGSDTVPVAAELGGCRRLPAVALRRAGVGFLLFAFGCGSFSTPVRAPGVDHRPLPETEAQPYRLNVGDELEFRFYYNPELNDRQVIRPDGKVSLPFVGHVEAAGRSPEALEAELLERFSGELLDPRITVIVRGYAPLRIYVGGEVGNQGAFDLRSPITLLAAIQEAGGLLPTARRRQVLLIRRSGDGEPFGRAVDLRPVLSGEHPELDVELRPSDIVFVPRTKIANVNVFVDQYIDGVIPDLLPPTLFVAGIDQ